MQLLTNPTTPYPYHGRQSSDPIRNDFEGEQWNDLANAIFAAKAVILKLPVSIAGTRVWITAQADLNAAGTLTISVDGAAQTPTTSIAGAGTAVVNTFIDLTPGDHTVEISSAATLSDPLIMARRGRIPTLI